MVTDLPEKFAAYVNLADEVTLSQAMADGLGSNQLALANVRAALEADAD